MDRLQKGSARIANGDLSEPIDTSKMSGTFKTHGENINKVGEGIAKAVEDQLKSERFKTELITNVSHDIKTPLTSIINYVDLIKKEEITDPTLCEYVEVLDRQSGRLKKLIEDLMEASKASTGNLKVELETCDLSMLIGQVIGEFEDRFTGCGLEVVITKSEKPIYVMADGRHLWRVLDNLMTNIYKYSLPNSRVYIDLEQKEKQAVISFKNISKTQLNISSEELMERFVRGDSSRNTEGSGLGLAIAQSLTELMGGTMRLEIDGDLFKVMLTYEVVDRLKGSPAETKTE
jgi:signal transduction histidine kinase